MRHRWVLVTCSTLFLFGSLMTAQHSFGQENLLNGKFTGGNASVVQIAGYDGAEPYHDDLETGCDSPWRPQGTLCDEAPNTNDPDLSTKIDANSGATWQNYSKGTGVLVIDVGDFVRFNEFRIFQMFSDGKITHVRFAVHHERGTTPPDWEDSRWKLISDFENVGEGDTSDGGYTVNAPTTLSLRTRGTRYLRIEARNSGKYGDDSYIELRAVKMFLVRPCGTVPSSLVGDGSHSVATGMASVFLMLALPAGAVMALRQRRSRWEGRSRVLTMPVPQPASRHNHGRRVP